MTNVFGGRTTYRLNTTYGDHHCPSHQHTARLGATASFHATCSKAALLIQVTVSYIFS